MEKPILTLLNERETGNSPMPSGQRKKQKRNAKTLTADSERLLQDSTSWKEKE